MSVDDVRKIWDEFKAGISYQKSMGFDKSWPKFERFLAGDQWPPATKLTQNMPRPVFNIIKSIQDHKVASVCNETIKPIFTPQETDDERVIEAARLFTAAAERIWESINQDDLSEEALRNGSNRGLCAWHYFWNPEKKGGNQAGRLWTGDIDGEVIDPANIIFGDPLSTTMERQPYIIIPTQMQVSAARKMAEKAEIPKERLREIVADDESGDAIKYYAEHFKPENSQKVTVLTKYYRNDGDGKIYFSKCTSKVMFIKGQNTGLTDYPVVIMPWERRKSCIYGIGDTEALIPNQVGINYILAMMLYSVQLSGAPKVRAKADAIKYALTNLPGEIVIDHSQINGWGIDYMDPPQVPSYIPALMEKYMELTKEVSGANENFMGERSTGDLNATAIMLLQQAAGVPVEGIRKRYHRSMRQAVRVWEQLIKKNYTTERLLKYEEADGKESFRRFTGMEYEDLNFDLRIDVGPASTYSEALAQSSLDKLYGNGDITFEQYLRYAPQNVAPFKEELLQEIDEKNPYVWTLLQGLTPDERYAFVSLPPEEQDEMLSRALSRPVTIDATGRVRDAQKVAPKQTVQIPMEQPVDIEEMEIAQQAP